MWLCICKAPISSSFALVSRILIYYNSCLFLPSPQRMLIGPVIFLQTLSNDSGWSFFFFLDGVTVSDRNLGDSAAL